MRRIKGHQPGLGAVGAIDRVKVARENLWREQKALLESSGWKGIKSDYDLITRWFHEDVGTTISRATAVDLAMGELEIDRG